MFSAPFWFFALVDQHGSSPYCLSSGLRAAPLISSLDSLLFPKANSAFLKYFFANVVTTRVVVVSPQNPTFTSWNVYGGICFLSVNITLLIHIEFVMNYYSEIIFTNIFIKFDIVHHSCSTFHFSSSILKTTYFSFKFHSGIFSPQLILINIILYQFLSYIFIHQICYQLLIGSPFIKIINYIIMKLYDYYQIKLIYYYYYDQWPLYIFNNMGKVQMKC